MRSIRDTLDSVRRRLWWANIVHTAAIGLAAGAAAGAALAIARVLLPDMALWLPIAAVAVGGFVGGAVGACRAASITTAANVIDNYYGLKDRALTALQFEKTPDEDPVRRLQLQDAERHLAQVRPAECVPVAAPRQATRAAAVFVGLTVGLLWYSEFGMPRAVAATSLPLGLQQASLLRETMLPEIEQLAKEQEDPELEELAEQLKEMVAELEKEGIEDIDMMATLSEMELSLSEAREAMQLEMADAQFSSIAGAMQPADAMREAAAAMMSGDYEKATTQLEKLDASKLSDKERRAVADNLKKFAAKLSPGQQGQISEAAQQLQEGLENQDASMCKAGVSKLAGLCKKQGLKKKIGECMACQLNRLSQCKSECRGQCNTPGNNVAKSDSSSQKWGMGKSGKATGDDATELDGSRRQEQLTSQQGEGPSESETIESPEGEQEAARQYAQRYQEFRKQAEAVLDQEPLPLGHRETVRQYFENIRPNQETDALQ